jgi:hypothetical protein
VWQQPDHARLLAPPLAPGPHVSEPQKKRATATLYKKLPAIISLLATLHYPTPTRRRYTAVLGLQSPIAGHRPSRHRRCSSPRRRSGGHRWPGGEPGSGGGGAGELVDLTGVPRRGHVLVPAATVPGHLLPRHRIRHLLLGELLCSRRRTSRLLLDR